MKSKPPSSKTKPTSSSQPAASKKESKAASSKNSKPLSPKKKGRYGPEMQQEDDSKPQILTWLRRWNIGTYGRDLGEDFVVQINHEDGNWTGLSFHLQAKSTTTLGQMLAKGKAGHFGYSLKVQDLLRWEDANPPVFLVVWDVGMNEGRWEDVPTIVAALDKSGKGWRRRTKVTVPIPDKNKTDAESKVLIRHRVASLASPLHAGRPLEGSANFSFPQDTEEGRSLAEQFRRTLDEGGTCLIPGEFVEAQFSSSWFTRIYGAEVQVESLEMSSAHVDVPLRVHLLAVSPTASEAIPIDLKLRKAGRRQATFDNSDDPDAIVKLSLVCEGLDQEHGPRFIRTHYDSRFTGRHLLDVIRLVRFYRVLRDGGQAFLGGPTGRQWGATPHFSAKNLPEEGWLRWFEGVLQKLTFVQTKIKAGGEFDLSSGFTANDERVLDELHSLFTVGYWDIETNNFKLTLTRVPRRLTEEELAAKENMIRFELPNESRRLLGVEIPLGRIRAEIRNCSNLPKAMDEAAKSRRKVLQLGNAVMRHTLISEDGTETMTAAGA